MRGIETQVRKVRRRVFKEIADLAYQSGSQRADQTCHGNVAQTGGCTCSCITGCGRK